MNIFLLIPNLVLLLRDRSDNFVLLCGSCKQVVRDIIRNVTKATFLVNLLTDFVALSFESHILSQK